MGFEAYHQSELDIARNPNDPRRAMPDFPGDCRNVLDVGAGAGQTLIAANLSADCGLFAVDIDQDALKLGRQWAPHIGFVRAVGEHLPFQRDSFDFVMSRVALPLMHMPSALAEIERVLQPGGRIWIVLHPFSLVRNQWLKGLKALRFKNVAFRTYVIVNGLVWNATGRQFYYPLNRKYCESFQSDAGIRRALSSLGLEDIRITRVPRFVVTARKPVSRAGA